MSSSSHHFEGEGHVSPFHGLDKGTVLQQSKVFSLQQISPRDCSTLLVKILWVIHSGTQQFTPNEATNLFFGITKLFQAKDPMLRRMVYLVLKELQPLVEDALIITSSLCKDIASSETLYQANAMRVLCTIIDSSMISGVERYLKQGVVNQDPFVASAAVVTAVHLHRENSDVIRRWVSEVQEAVVSKSDMLQYHALGLLKMIKKHDKVALAKLVNNLKYTIRSPYAHCLLIRYAVEVIPSLSDSSEVRAIYEYLESCLRNRSEMVIYEAARAMCALPNISARDLTPAITVLQLFLSSPKPTLRFAAVRTLNTVAQNNALSVSACNLDLENLIMDSNRSIATLAISTLLKTGSEASIDHLMKQISNFMSEIADEFKILVVEAIQSLCLKYPQKHRTLLSFLSSALRDEGGFEYKRAIVNTICFLMDSIPECKDTALSHLCEFIEDCEFTSLSTFILNLLGRVGPSTTAPHKYIRYIYNRVILEKSAVRASAVTALAKFGVQVETLRPSIVVLLQRSLLDSDDEVRDRAAYYLSVLSNQAQEEQEKLVLNTLPASLKGLELALSTYLQHPTTEAFDLSAVRAIDAELAQEALAKGGSARGGGSSSSSGGRGGGSGSSSGAGGSSGAVARESLYAESLKSIPEFASFGPLFSSSKEVELSEPETEYPVTCVKHVFDEHIVFQFNVTNTLPDALLEKVTVKMDSELMGVEGGFEEVARVPLAKLPYDTPGVCFVAMERAAGTFPVTAFDCLLRFDVKDVDPETGEVESEEGFEDEFVLEAVEVSTSDYMQGTYVSNFKAAWDTVGEENQVVETFYLATMKSLKEAISSIVTFLGMEPVDHTNKVDADNGKAAHVLLLSGLFVGNVAVLVRARLILDQQNGGVHLELGIRSEDEFVSHELASAIA